MKTLKTMSSSFIEKNNACLAHAFAFFIINNINLYVYVCVCMCMSPDRRHSRNAIKKEKRETSRNTSARIYIIHCSFESAVDPVEPIDRYYRIINMTVQYLKNLSFLCNLFNTTVLTKCTICFIALT